MKTILGIETATPYCSVALLHEGKCMQRIEHAPRKQSDMVLGMVQQILADAVLSLNQVDAIAYGAGPGSFMGVRLATCVAQGLAYPNEISVVPVSCLAALAYAAFECSGQGRQAAAMDARMGEVYSACYECSAEAVTPLMPDTLSAPNEIDLSNPVLTNACFSGNGWALLDVTADLPEAISTAAACVQLAMFSHDDTAAIHARPVYLRNNVAS